MKKKTGKGEEANNTRNDHQVGSQNLSIARLLALDHNDLAISYASLKPYRGNLKKYFYIQTKYFGESDSIQISSYKAIGEMSKHHRESIGYTSGVASSVRKYISSSNSDVYDQYSPPENDKIKILQNSSVKSALKQRDVIKKAVMSPYAIKTKNLPKSTKTALNEYILSRKNLREGVVKDILVKILRFLGYVYNIKGKGDVEVINELVDLITIENAEGYKDFIVSRHGKVTRSVYLILTEMYMMLKSDELWLSQHINPLKSKDQSLREISHRNGRRGILNWIQKDYDETGQKKYLNRKRKLSIIQRNIFDFLTPDEQKIYVDQARIEYLNVIVPKFHILVKKYEDEAKNNGMTKNPFFPIMPLLDLDDPSEPISLALQNSAAEICELLKLPPTLKIARIIRNHIFVSLISLWPLRRSHWLKMTYLSDQSGHLGFTKKGDLIFNIPIDDFKNSKSKIFTKMRSKGEAVDNIIKYEDESELIELIKTYIAHYLPFLKLESDKLLYSSEDVLAYGCHKWQEEYLHPTCDKMNISRPLLFGSHSFRHICVTSMIKVHRSVELAANLILDNLTTVINNYSAFLPNKGCQDAINLNINRRKMLKRKSK